jgi:EAL domain-containing protein (putative c-di-GMP-specific phosphodiesterase class I)
LQRALGADELELHYQPVIDLKDSRVVAVEALIRWHHVRRGQVPPGELIAAAEESGLIVPLGDWVLDRALGDLARWQRDVPALLLTMNVNVSAREILALGFSARVIDALTRWRIPGNRLVVEVTETGLLTDDAQILADLEALRSRGVRIALDDFGTGYSSLDYVRRHAIDMLKIDRTFTDGIDRSHRQAALVQAIVDLAGSLGLSVVAEGVETRAQRDALLLAGCELGQGFLFSAALSADSIARCLLTDKLDKHWVSASEQGVALLPPDAGSSTAGVGAAAHPRPLDNRGSP